MTTDSSEPAAVLMGMPGFVVLSADEIDGEVWLLVETTAKVAGCLECGTVAQLKDRRTVPVRDLEAGGRPVVIAWKKRRWRCPEPECPKRSWTEESGAIAPRSSLTRRARVECCRAVGENADSVSFVARRFGVSWDTVMGAVAEHGRPKVDDPGRIEETTQLGTDETTWLAATPDHPTIFATSLVDTLRGKLIDVIEGRDSRVLRSWLAARGTDWLMAVTVVSIDPFEAYRKGLSPSLDHAVVVADPFHIVRLGNRALDKVRRRTQQELTGHRGRRGDPLYDVRKILLTASERLTEKTFARMQAALDSSDSRDEVVASWLAKEHLREVYAVEDPEAAEKLLDAVITECATSEIKELATLGGTLSEWKTEILNHHLSAVT